MLRLDMAQTLVAVINFPTLLRMPDYMWLQDVMFPITGPLALEKPRKNAQVFIFNANKQPNTFE